MHPYETTPVSSVQEEGSLPATTNASTSAATPTATAVAGEESWKKRNQRRLQLIDKEFSEGLEPEEERELTALQEELAHQLSTALPLPFAVVEELKTCAQREGLLSETSEPVETAE